jgi:hypothetical protein
MDLAEAEARLNEIKSLCYSRLNDFDNFTKYDLQMIEARAEGRPRPLAPVMSASERLSR